MGLEGRRHRLVACAATAVIVAVVGATPTTSTAQEATSEPAPAVPTVGIVGDSLMVQSRAAIEQRVEAGHEVVSFVAEDGQTIRQLHDRAVAAASAPDGPDVVIVGLGANDADQEHTDAEYDADVRALLDGIVPHVSCVRWFELKTAPAPTWFGDYAARAARFNQVLADVADDYPAVETIALTRWARIAGGSYFEPDGLHFSDTGKDQVGYMARQAAEGCDAGITSSPLWDVPDHHPFAADIGWITDTGVATGYRNRTYGTSIGTFSIPVSRAAMAAFLHRLAGTPAPGPIEPRFVDVGPDHPFFEEIEWLAGTGITTGYHDGTFRPTAIVSRQTMAPFLHRLAPLLPPPPP